MEQGIMWSGENIAGPLALVVGAKYRKVVNARPPAAGSDWVLTVPGGYEQRVLLGYLVFVASATVASRSINIGIYYGDAQVWNLAIATGITAGTTATIGLNSGDDPYPYSIGNSYQGIIPKDMLLAGGSRIVASTTNLQSGDQWTVASFLLDEYVIGQQIPATIYRNIPVQP